MTVYDCDRTVTLPTRGRRGPSPKPKKTSAPSPLSAVKPDPVPQSEQLRAWGFLDTYRVV